MAENAELLSEPTAGVKHDSGKLRMDLVPPEAIKAMADVLTSGAAKYGDRNWEKGLAYSRAYAATQRHLVDWWSGVDVDHESGKSPLVHAITELAFLVTFEARGMDAWDDRPKQRTNVGGRWNG